MFKNNLFCFGIFFLGTEKGQKADAMWLALLGCCRWEESGRRQEWRREQNVINQQQKYQRSKGLKAAVKITCCLTQGHNSPNRICSCFPSCSQSGRRLAPEEVWTGLGSERDAARASPWAPQSTAAHQPVHSGKGWSLSHLHTDKCGQQDC